MAARNYSGDLNEINCAALSALTWQLHWITTDASPHLSWLTHVPCCSCSSSVAFIHMWLNTPHQALGDKDKCFCKTREAISRSRCPTAAPRPATGVCYLFVHSLALQYNLQRNADKHLICWVAKCCFLKWIGVIFALLHRDCWWANGVSSDSRTAQGESDYVLYKFVT